MNRRLASIVIGCAVLAGAATVGVAQTDVIKQRETLMKEYGSDTRPVAGMLRGANAFDLATVQKALDTYAANSKKLIDLFPAGSGEGTDALPAIWERKAEFDALFEKLAADATAARASITDEASFKANFPAVIRTCGTCHDSFRQKS